MKVKIKEGLVKCTFGNRKEVVEGTVVADIMWHGGAKIIVGDSCIWCIGFTTIIEYI